MSETWSARDSIALVAVVLEDGTGWLHTAGMEEYDLPNLEMRDIPLFLVESAATLMNHIAEYFHHAKEHSIELGLGHTITVSSRTKVHLVQMDPFEGKEQMYERPFWGLVSDPSMHHVCDSCAGHH